MFKKALLVLAASATLFGSGCIGTKWLTIASQLGYNITGMLDNLGVLTG